MILLDGKLTSQKRRAALKPRIEAFKAETGRAPHLVVVLVGENPASQVYVRNKAKACEDAGIKSTQIDLPANVTQEDLSSAILRLNSDPYVDGILLQLPLPAGLQEEPLLEILSDAKDADGFTFSSLGRLLGGAKLVAPCTPQGIIHLLQEYGISIAGKNCVVVGRSTIVGKPMGQLLLAEDATVTMCHSKTKDLRSFTSQADIVIVAAGKKHLLGKEDFKKDAVVVDVGIHGSGQKGAQIAGDVRFDEVKDWVSAITPVPGGVGPMTIATLLENTVRLAELRAGRK